MVKCGVFFAVRTEFLNIIQTSFSFRGLKKSKIDISMFRLIEDKMAIFRWERTLQNGSADGIYCDVSTQHPLTS
jgi:hypothetical protein